MAQVLIISPKYSNAETLKLELEQLLKTLPHKLNHSVLSLELLDGDIILKFKTSSQPLERIKVIKTIYDSFSSEAGFMRSKLSDAVIAR